MTSKTAQVGDSISLTLAEDVKAGGVVLVKQGAPCVVTITQVEKPRVQGVPGEIFFKAEYLKDNGAVIKLHGSAAKEGQDQLDKAIALTVIPPGAFGLLVRGKDAEIKQGAKFTAFVDEDTVLPSN